MPKPPKRRPPAARLSSSMARRRPDGFQPQVQVHAALDDAEERLVGARVGRQAAPRPACRQVHGAFHERALGGIRRALVQLHGDVGAQLLLDAHVVLGRPAHLGAVVDGAEREPVVVQLQRVGQAEHLEAARIGEHGAVVVHERMHAAGLGHHVRAGAQRQVVRVRQHHLGVQVAQLSHRHALDRRARAHGHEHGRAERAVRRLVGKRAGVAALRLAARSRTAPWSGFLRERAMRRRRSADIERPGHLHGARHLVVRHARVRGKRRLARRRGNHARTRCRQPGWRMQEAPPPRRRSLPSSRGAPLPRPCPPDPADGR